MTELPTEESRLTDDARGSIWTDGEVDLIVADYFDMLTSQLADRPFSKAHHNDALQQLLPRSRKSIEFKHCNISAVLVRLGMPTIPGYKPLPHFQNALVDAIGRYLAIKGQPVFAFATATVPRFAEASLWLEPPPSPTLNEAKETDRLRRLVRKFDPAERDARNRALGKQGEELILAHERQRLIAGERADLARKLEWTSEEQGDGAGYDIHSFELDGRDRLIEVKTTNGPAITPFFLTENERAFSEERPDAFRLLRLYRFIEKPSAFELAPPLHERLTLSPTNYRATF
ncbi:MAG: hypothetical protein JWO81_157 [Alphaproteobacteria bacterium]|nr:hypothetical protein [Alphaproteobacteria bacterium]